MVELSIDEICDSLRKKIIKQNELLENGKYPVINSGITLYGRYNDFNNNGNAIVIASRGEYAGFITYMHDDFWAGGLCYPYRSKDEKKYSTRYVYEYLKKEEKTIMETLVMRGGIPALNKADVGRIKIPIPPIEEQERIVRILDTFTAGIENVKKQLFLRHKQYEYYRNHLLNPASLPNAEMIPLGDCCIKTKKIKWKDVSNDDIFLYVDLSSVIIETHQIKTTCVINKENAPSRAQQIINNGDILFGTTRPTLKRYCQVSNSYHNQICSTGFCIFRANTKITNSRWIFHNIGTNRFWEYCENNQKGAGYPCISNSDAYSFRIPILNLPEQERIVNLLDSFETSISNLEQQLALREKQYEYYRNKLLTF